MNDLDKVFAALNESGPEVGGGLPTRAEQEKGAVSFDEDLDRKLTAAQIEQVRAAIAALPTQVSPQIKTLFGQAARWLTFEELLQAYTQIISSGVTKTITVDNVPVLNKSQTMRARKAEKE